MNRVTVRRNLVTLYVKAQLGKSTFPVETMPNQVGWVLESSVVLQCCREALKGGSVVVTLGEEKLLSVKDGRVLPPREVADRYASSPELDEPRLSKGGKWRVGKTCIVEESDFGAPEGDAHHVEIDGLSPRQGGRF